LVELSLTTGLVVRMGGVVGSGFGPVTQALDLFAHRRGEWHGVGEDSSEIQLSRFAVFREGAVERLDEGGFDLGSGKQLTRPG